MTCSTAPHHALSTAPMHTAWALACHAFFLVFVPAVVMLLSTTAPAAEPLRVIYPRSESRKDGRAIFPIAVLQLALEHSGREFRLQPSQATMQQARSIRMLSDGRELDVLWTVATPAREKQLRPIRIPIDLGLIGWRVLLIRSGDAQRFASIDSIAALSLLLGGQGHDWPDLAILRANGLQVAASPTYEGLFAMLVRGHIDYFPRGIDEVDRELERRSETPVEIEPTLLLHYPAPLYFFVNPGNDALARALETGLEACIADGSLRDALQQRFSERISSLNIAQRKILELHNADLPEATPLARNELWFEPGGQK